MCEEKKFYVYALLDPRKPGRYEYGELKFDYEPFYIGKGSRLRCYVHDCPSTLRCSKNSYETNKIRKIISTGLKIITQKIQSNMKEDEAYSLEEKLIAIIGRKYEKRPSNQHRQRGRIAPSLTPEQKKKIGDAHRRQFQSGERIHPWVGRKHTKESRKKITNNHSDYWINKHHTTESKNKISRANSGKRFHQMCNTYQFISPEGCTYTVDTGLEYFCQQHGLTLSCVTKVIKGVRRHHKKWKVIKITTKNSGKTKQFVVFDPNNKKYEVQNLLKFCREQDLQYPLMIKVSNGERAHHKQWKCSHIN